MNMRSISFIVLLVALFTASTQGAAPVLTGYAYSYDVSSILTISPIPVLWSVGYQPHFSLYHEVVGNTLRIGLVCESNGGWCGFGLSSNGLMPGGDAVVGYVNATGDVFLADYFLAGQSEGSATNCAANVPNNFVCSDETTSTQVCQNNVQLVNGTRVGNYTILEFTRPITGIDTCDKGLNTIGTSSFILLGMGPLYTSRTFPYTLRKHTARTEGNLALVFNYAPVQTTGTTGVFTTTGQVTTTGASTTGQSAMTTGLVTTGIQGTTGMETTGSATGASTTGANCNNLTQQCKQICSPQVVTLCRCVSNSPVVECGDASGATFTTFSVSFLVCFVSFFLIKRLL